MSSKAHKTNAHADPTRTYNLVHAVHLERRRWLAVEQSPRLTLRLPASHLVVVVVVVVVVVCSRKSPPGHTGPCSPALPDSLRQGLPYP